MKKILILGSSGFIGRNMLEFFSLKTNQYIVHAPAHNMLDILNQYDIENYLKQHNFDIVINCLDISGNPINYMEQRLRMFSNLYKYSTLYGKMIYFGSGAEYDRFRSLSNISETAFGEIIPTDAYGLGLYYMSLLSEQSMNIYNFRLFGIFGKYELWQKRFISNAICKKLYGYPITIRENRTIDYLDVEDLCKITQWAIESTPKYHLYNAVSGVPYDLKAIADMVNSIDNVHIPIFIAKDSIAPDYTASNLRLKNEIDFELKDMLKSIRDLYGWYEQNLIQIDKYSLLYQN